MAGNARCPILHAATASAGGGAGRAPQARRAGRPPHGDRGGAGRAVRASDRLVPGVGKRRAGSSLIEVLIALAVLSVGALGVGAGMAAALGADRGSMQRVQAAQRAAELIDRARANRPALAAGAYDLERRYAEITVSPLDGACTSPSPSCAPATFAAADIASWNARNAALLPGGRGSIRGDPAGYVVSLMWSGGPSLAGTVDPACTLKSPPEAVPGLRCLNVPFLP